MRHFDETLKYYNAISCRREMQKRLLEENNDLHLQGPFTIFQNYSVVFAIYYDCVYLQNLKKLTVLTEGESLEALKSPVIAELFEEILSTIFRNSNEKTTYFADLKEEIKFKFVSNSLVFLNCFGYVKHSSLPI